MEDTELNGSHLAGQTVCTNTCICTCTKFM